MLRDLDARPNTSSKFLFLWLALRGGLKIFGMSGYGLSMCGSPVLLEASFHGVLARNNDSSKKYPWSAQTCNR